MRIQVKPLITALALLTITSLSSCRKDIDVPSPEMEQLFGTWELVSQSGGFGGTTKTDFEDNLVEFEKNGIHKTIVSGKTTDKSKFTIINNPNAFEEAEYIVRYSKISLRSNKKSGNFFDQSITFAGPDTLILRDQCDDCYSYEYVRK